MSVLSMMSRQMRLSMTMPTTTRHCCRLFRQKARGVVEKAEVVESQNTLPPASWGVLARPAVFTAVFTGTTIGGCAVWQYEGMRREALRSKVMGWGWTHRKKAGELREEMRMWWAGLGEGRSCSGQFAG